MNIKDIILTMRTLGIGEVYNDSDEIYLRFINLAHNELYPKTAALNDDLYITEKITTVPNQASITLSQEPFLVDVVWCETTEMYLEGKSFGEFNKYKRKKIDPGYPAIYSNTNRTINISPISSNIPYVFEVDFKPELTEFNINTPESAIPYPKSFHMALAHGGLYYVFQDESGFKNTLKENEAKSKWDNIQLDLVSYLYGRSKQRNSMYERI